MYLLIILTVVTIAGVIIATNLHWSSNWELPVWLVTGMSGLTVFTMLITLGVSHLTADSTIAQYEIIKETIEASRVEEMSELERATLTQKIIEVNQEIAGYKYWNETSWDIFTPDQLTELEYLK